MAIKAPRWGFRIGWEDFIVTVRREAQAYGLTIDDRHFSLLTPDSDKLGLSAGAAWSWPMGHGAMAIEAGYMHVIVSERSVDPAGGTAGTILNKPAPSFYYGVARARFDIASVALSLRM